MLLDTIDSESFLSKMQEDSKVYSNFEAIFSKVRSDGYFPLFFDKFKFIFEREIVFAHKELSRIKAEHPALNVSETLKTNIFVFKENFKLIVQSSLDKLWAKLMEPRQFELIVNRLKHQHGEAIIETIEESILSDARSKKSLESKPSLSTQPPDGLVKKHIENLNLSSHLQVEKLPEISNNVQPKRVELIPNTLVKAVSLGTHELKECHTDQGEKYEMFPKMENGAKAKALPKAKMDFKKKRTGRDSTGSGRNSVGSSGHAKVKVDEAYFNKLKLRITRLEGLTPEKKGSAKEEERGKSSRGAGDCSAPPGSAKDFNAWKLSKEDGESNFS